MLICSEGPLLLNYWRATHKRYKLAISLGLDLEIKNRHMYEISVFQSEDADEGKGTCSGSLCEKNRKVFQGWWRKTSSLSWFYSCILSLQTRPDSSWPAEALPAIWPDPCWSLVPLNGRENLCKYKLWAKCFRCKFLLGYLFCFGLFKW